MRLAIVTPVFPPYLSGMGNIAWQNAVLLTKRGYKVTVFTPRYENSLLREEIINGVVVKRLLPKIQYGNAAWIIGWEKELADFDIVHLHYPFIGGVGEVLQAKKKYCWPLVLTYHMDLLAGGWKGIFFLGYQKIILPRLIKATDKVLVSTLDYAKSSGYLSKFLKSVPKKFSEAPFGVDTNKFRPVDNIEISGLQDLRRELDLKEKEKTVLFVGGLDKAHAFKGIEILLQAWLRIKNAKLVIVGKGDCQREFEMRTKVGGLTNSVRFAGKVEIDKLVKYYQLSDVLVLPSVNRSEAYGIVLLEAMACGKPIVTSDLPGVRTQVSKDRGLLFPAGNSVALSNALEKILVDDEYSLQLGKNARQWVTGHRTLNQEIDKLETVYNSLALQSKM